MRKSIALQAPYLVYLLLVLALLVCVLRLGWAAAWQGLAIPSLLPPFADLRTVQAGLSAMARGLDPQVVNPGDPWGRPMNYPSVWLGIARVLHWEVERNYLLFAGACAAAFVACCWDLIRRWPSWWTVAVAVSGAPALLVERGNNDSVIFVLLYLACIVARPVFAVLLPLATLLKLYPLVALPAFAERRNWPAVALAGLGCGLAVAGLAGELRLIRGATPAAANMSFGLPVYSFGLSLAGITLSPLALGLGMAAAAVAVRRLCGAALEAEGAALPERRLFVAGTAIIVATSVLGVNWDYRLSFLLLCMPLLARLRSVPLAIGLRVGILLACNQPWLELSMGMAGYGLNLAAKALLPVLLAPLAIAALPRERLGHPARQSQ